MQRPSRPPTRLAYFSKHAFHILCLVVIMLGLFFRFYNLEKKVFWHDETYTAIAVSGYERGDVRRDLILSLGLNTEEILDYQSIDSDTTWEDTLGSVADEEPQNSPLYFLLSRFWVQLTQLPVALGMRSLSVVISLLAFPATFWLCLELFQSLQAAWLGTALIGISPVHLLYAQEARQYSLLTVATLVASALLIRVTRQKNLYLLLLNWCLYTILCVLGLYTQPFFLFVMVGHGIYVLFQKPFSVKNILSYSLSSIVSVLVYAPWLYVILTDLEAISGWRGDTELSFSGLIGRWLLNLSRIFADFYVGDSQNYDLAFSLTNPLFYLALGLFCLVGYSFYYLIRKTPRNVWLFVVTLSIFPTLFLAIADLVEGGVRSTIPRYILPSFLGIQLAIVAVFAAKLFGKITWKYQPILWRGAIALLLTLSCFSCLQISQASVWWSKYSNYYDTEVLALINDSPSPAVLGHGTIRLASLSTRLRDDALLQLTDGKTITRLPIPERENIFVYDLEVYTRSIVQTIRRQYGFDAELIYSQPLGFIHTDIQVWRVIPIRNESLIQSFRELDANEGADGN